MPHQQGKKSAWQAWQGYEDFTETFMFLATHPFENSHTDSRHFQNIERLIVLLYDRTTSVNEAREELFCRKNRSMDRIPPTQDALLQHTSRNMDNQHSGAASGSISTRFCLVEGSSDKCMGASLDNDSRSLQSMQ